MIRAWRPRSGDGTSASLVAFERPTPALAEDEVLVSVEGSVFGTPERMAIPDITPGGAAVGTVMEAGQGAAELRGLRVLVGPDMGCGECDVCRRAGVSVCPHGVTLGRTAHGTLASAVVARARWVCALEGALSIPGPEAALVAREVSWAYAMFVRAGVGPGEPVVIVGHGVVARFLVDIAVARGTRPLVTANQRIGWQAWIRDHGGIPVSWSPESPEQARHAFRAAAMDNGHGERPWHVFETSAERESRCLALSVAGPGARVVMLTRRALGCGAPGDTLDIDTALDLDGSILGVAGAHPDLLPEVAALVVRGDIDITSAAHVVAPATLADALARQARDDDAPRALVVRTNA